MLGDPAQGVGKLKVEEELSANPRETLGGARLALPAAGVTVKLAPLLRIPLTATTTLPVVAPVGTVAVMLVEFQEPTLAVVPLKVTVLAPCDGPKPVPAIVTEAPTKPELGVKLVMLGTTVNATALLARPPTMTTTLPVVAALGTDTVMLVLLQLVGVAATPLKSTVP